MVTPVGAYDPRDGTIEVNPPRISGYGVVNDLARSRQLVPTCPRSLADLLRRDSDRAGPRRAGRPDQLVRRGLGRSGDTTPSRRGVHPAAHPPRLSTAAVPPAPEPHGEAPPPIAARHR